MLQCSFHTRAAKLSLCFSSVSVRGALSSQTGNMVAPTIDFSNYEERKQEIAKQLFEAARDVGFFYISGHGIPEEDIQKAFAQGQRFLSLPDEVKTKYPFNPDSYLGHRGPDELETVTGNRLWEWFSVGRWGLKGYNFKEQTFQGEAWPEELDEEFRSFALDFQRQTHELSLKILKALAIGLGWDESKFDDPFDLDSEENPSFMAWNYYPPVTPEQQEEFRKAHNGKLPPRLHAHADMDVLTVLFQRVGEVGLEIAPGNEVDDLSLIEDVGNIWNHVPVARTWHALDPKPGCVTVNIGDALTRWTDGILKSTYHRVRTPKEGEELGSRYSIPYFVNPKLNYVIQGPQKRWGPVTGFDMLSKTGNAYAARKNSPDKSWQQAAYTDETVTVEEAAAKALAQGNGKGNGTSHPRQQVKVSARLAAPTHAPAAAAGPIVRRAPFAGRRVMGNSLGAARAGNPHLHLRPF